MSTPVYNPIPGTPFATCSLCGAVCTAGENGTTGVHDTFHADLASAVEVVDDDYDERIRSLECDVSNLETLASDVERLEQRLDHIGDDD